MPTATLAYLKKIILRNKLGTQGLSINTHYPIFIVFYVYTVVKFCLLFVVYLIKVICFIQSCMMLTNSDKQAW